jgi:hypothetical protein
MSDGVIVPIVDIPVFEDGVADILELSKVNKIGPF